MKQFVIGHSVTPRTGVVLDNYLRDIAKYPLLTVDEEVDLARRAHAGDKEAFDKLVCCNLRFVVSVAKHYQSMNVPFADLISAGNIGLMTAAERFDETMGFKFCSYAVCWIRQSILKSVIDTSRAVRLPSNMVANISKLRNEERRLEQELGRTPTSAELVEALDMDDDTVRSILKNDSAIVYLDAPVDNDGETTLSSMLENHTAPAPDAELMNDSRKVEIDRALQTIPQNEREIIKMSFGLDMDRPYSFEEIALQFRLSRERVRQLQKQGLKRLCHSTSAPILRTML